MVYNLVEEKNANIKIKLMIWNPKIDIIAVCDVKNEILVHRINWQKSIWNKKPLNKSSNILQIDWRPDGQVLAIAYNSDKRIQLLSYENGLLIHDLNLTHEIKFISWHSLDPKYANSLPFLGEDLKPADYQKVLKKYLPQGKFDSVDKVLGYVTFDPYAPNPPFASASALLPPLPGIVGAGPDVSPPPLIPASSSSTYEVGEVVPDHVTYPGDGDAIYPYGLAPYWTKRLGTDGGTLHLLAVYTIDPGALHVYAYGLFPLLTLDDTNFENLSRVEFSHHTEYLLCASVPPTKTSFKGTDKASSDDITDDPGNTCLSSPEKEAAAILDLILITQLNQCPASAHGWREIRSVSRLLFGSQEDGIEGIFAVLGYAGTAIEYVREAWEAILLEIDSKFDAILGKGYRGTGADDNVGNLCDELLELLTWGTATPAFRSILVSELNPFDIRKSLHKLDTNYSRIQNLLERNLKPACLKLTTNLSQLRAFSVWRSKFYHLFPEKSDVLDGYMDVVEEFNLKIMEMQGVIRESAKNYKTFFRWLISVADEIGGTLTGNGHDDKTYGEYPEDEDSFAKIDEIVRFILDTFNFQWDPSVKMRVHVDTFGHFFRDARDEYHSESVAQDGDHFSSIGEPPGPNLSLVRIYHKLLLRFRTLCASIESTFTENYMINTKTTKFRIVSDAYPSTKNLPAPSLTYNEDEALGRSCFYALLSVGDQRTLLLLRLDVGQNLTNATFDPQLCHVAILELSDIMSDGKSFGRFDLHHQAEVMVIWDATLHGNNLKEGSFEISILLGSLHDNTGAVNPSSTQSIRSGPTHRACWVTVERANRIDLKSCPSNLSDGIHVVRVDRATHTMDSGTLGGGRGGAICDVKNLNAFEAKLMALNPTRNLACLYSPHQARVQMYVRDPC